MQGCGEPPGEARLWGVASLQDAARPWGAGVWRDSRVQGCSVAPECSKTMECRGMARLQGVAKLRGSGVQGCGEPPRCGDAAGRGEAVGCRGAARLRVRCALLTRSSSCRGAASRAGSGGGCCVSLQRF